MANATPYGYWGRQEGDPDNARCLTVGGFPDFRSQCGAVNKGAHYEGFPTEATGVSAAEPEVLPDRRSRAVGIGRFPPLKHVACTSAL